MANIPASVAMAFAKIDALDILINSAGISATGTVENNTSEEWHKVMNVNVVGIMRTSRAALPCPQPPRPSALRLSTSP